MQAQKTLPKTSQKIGRKTGTSFYHNLWTNYINGFTFFQQYGANKLSAHK